MPNGADVTTAIITEHIPAGQAEVVLGVDTHKDVHVAAVCTALGAAVAASSFPATREGYRRLLAWARAAGVVRRAGVEGTGSYGAGLSRYLRGEGVQVIEVNRPDRAARRRRGKSDTVDAEAAACSVISGRATAQPKSGDGPIEQIRVYKIAKDSAVKARRQAINQLKAILVSADPALREQLSGLGTRALVTHCAGLRDQPARPSAVSYTLASLAHRIKNLDAEITDLLARITGLIRSTAPALLGEHGVGADSAATLLVTAGDNPARLTGESAFAALCGVSPVEMSSGKTTRRRLNRGGDRQANAALHRIAVVRLRDQPTTRAYLDRRTAEGRTKREVIRCLKRYLARHLFQIIRRALAETRNTGPTTPTLAA
jgi:transposase